MRFEEALKCMREGKKVKSKNVIYSLFIADYTNGFGETYKAICWKDSLGNLIYHSLNHNDIFAEDWEVVEDDKLKNQQNFNISEGNVKSDDINVANNVAQENSQDLERVADTSKTLTEQWKHGKLEKGWYYYKASDGRNDIATEYGLYCVEADNNVELEVLAEVPDYIEWKNYITMYNYEHEENQRLKKKYDNIKVNGNYPDKISKLKSRIKGLTEELEPFTDPYFKGLNTKDIAELAKKSIRLTTQHCKDNEEIKIKTPEEEMEEVMEDLRKFLKDTRKKL